MGWGGGGLNFYVWRSTECDTVAKISDTQVDKLWGNDNV